MKSFFTTSFVIAAIPFVFGHGIVTSPPARAAGAAMEAACGQQVTGQQKSDNGGNVQGELQVASSQKDYDATKCNLFLCKGYQFADNAANVQAFTPGQVVPIKVAIKAPHTGVCNVSIVDTKANALIGSPLITFTDYASTAHTIPANNTDFSVTMPQDLGGKCAAAGDCVIQWFWDAPDIKQTYESCVDFTMGGGGPAAKVKPRQASVSTTVTTTSTATAMESMSMGPKTTMTMSAVSEGGAGSKTGTKSGADATAKTTATKSGGSPSETSSASASTSSSAQANDGQSVNAGSPTTLIASFVSLLLLLLL